MPIQHPRRNAGRPKSTSVESGEAIELEFIRRGKTNFKSTIWPCNHYMIETAKEGADADRRLDVLKEVFDWMNGEVG